MSDSAPPEWSAGRERSRDGGDTSTNQQSVKWWEEDSGRSYVIFVPPRADRNAVASCGRCLGCWWAVFVGVQSFCGRGRVRGVLVARISCILVFWSAEQDIMTPLDLEINRIDPSTALKSCRAAYSVVPPLLAGVWFLVSGVCCPRFNIYCPVSAVSCLFSTVYRQASTIYCPSFTVRCPLSTVASQSHGPGQAKSFNNRPSKATMHIRPTWKPHRQSPIPRPSPALSSSSLKPIRTVTIAGLTSTLTPTLLSHLTAANFTLRVLTRQKDSPSSLPFAASNLSIPIHPVDYTCPASLHRALLGQDAVISVLGDTPGAASAQRALIAASLAAGVRRFIPSEFGADTLHPRVRGLAFFREKVGVQEVLKRAAGGSEGFTYTIFITGPFLDWGLSVVPFIINVGGTTKVYDGGNVPFSTTRLSTLARAITASLHHHPAATANRVLYIHDGVVTQNLLLSFASTSPLPRVPVSTASRPAADPLACINRSLFSAEELCHFRRTDNKWLGLGELGAEEWRQVVREEVERAVEKFGVGMKGVEEAERAVEEGRRKVLGEEMAL